MAKFAFKIQAALGLVECALGFRDSGGPQDTAVYLFTTAALIPPSYVFTRAPAEIPGGFPGLNGRRVFLDLMGTSLTTAFFDFDLKIYENNGTQPTYQAPTTSVKVMGTCLSNITLNSEVRRGGSVGTDERRSFIAGMMGLITPEEINKMSAPSEEEQRARDQRFQQCVEGAGKYQTLGPGGGLGRVLGCAFEK